MAEQQVKDLYAVLGLEKDATAKEIQKAYRTLAKTKHPDVCHEPNAQEEFQKIKEAHEVLSDEDKRKEYDDFVRSMKDGKNKTFEDLFKDFHSGIEGVHSPIKGETIQVEVDFTIKDVKFQAEKKLKFDRFINCKDCEGHGFKRFNADPCSWCKATGYTVSEESSMFGDIKVEKPCSNCMGKGYINITNCEPCKGKGKLNLEYEMIYILPETTLDGTPVIFKGRGDEGLNGGVNGDLILIMKHSSDDEYTITNTYDIHKSIKVPYVKALTGGSMTVAAPSGANIKVPIPRGTQPGQVITVPDEGLLNSNNGFKGILALHVEIEVPKALSDSKIKKLVEILS